MVYSGGMNESTDQQEARMHRQIEKIVRDASTQGMIPAEIKAMVDEAFAKVAGEAAARAFGGSTTCDEPSCEEEVEEGLRYRSDPFAGKIYCFVHQHGAAWLYREEQIKCL